MTPKIKRLCLIIYSINLLILIIELSVNVKNIELNGKTTYLISQIIHHLFYLAGLATLFFTLKTFKESRKIRSTLVVYSVICFITHLQIVYSKYYNKPLFALGVSVGVAFIIVQLILVYQFFKVKSKEIRLPFKLIAISDLINLLVIFFAPIIIAATNNLELMESSNFIFNFLKLLPILSAMYLFISIPDDLKREQIVLQEVE